MSSLCRQTWKTFRRKHLSSIPRLDCGERLFFSPTFLSFERFLRSETRDHLINWKLSFSDKLLHDLSDPELWKWHKDQFPNSGLGVWGSHHGSEAHLGLLPKASSVLSHDPGPGTVSFGILAVVSLTKAEGRDRVNRRAHQPAPSREAAWGWWDTFFFF